jgi:exopolyphosphatase/guanosine-5'-triphosphate,3'-diphosphate pyrophosphatase
MRLAIIDCGTNTFNLLVIELLSNKQYTRIFNTRIPVKLGEGAINKGFIAEAPFNRGLDAIKTFKEEIKRCGVNKTLAFATSAIRDASNGVQFVQQVKQELDVNISVIDGDREAELIYFGVKEAVPLNDSTSLIIDIGGGSTEFILASRSQILWKQSFNLGAARLREKFSPSDPVTQAEITNIYTYLGQQLQPLMASIKQFPAVELIGSSGAFDSIVEMINGEMNGEPLTDKKTAYTIHLPDYFTISSLVRRSTLEERKQIKGLVPMRFDMIVISCLMVDFVLSSLQLDQLRVSTYSLKEGALVDFISKQSL